MEHRRNQCPKSDTRKHANHNLERSAQLEEKGWRGPRRDQTGGSQDALATVAIGEYRGKGQVEKGRV